MAKNTNKYFTQLNIGSSSSLEIKEIQNEIKWDMLLFFKNLSKKSVTKTAILANNLAFSCKLEYLHFMIGDFTLSNTS